MLINTSIRAASLFNALLIALLIAMLCSGIISVGYYYTLLNQEAELQTRLLRNAESGISLLRSSSKQEFYEVRDLFGREQDSVSLKKYPWGYFDVIAAEAFQMTFRGKASQQLTALLGQAPDELAKSALYLKDNFKPLTICGQTQINGTAWLPKAGIKSGYVDGQTYSGRELVYGDKKRSQSTLPALNQTRIKTIFQLFEQTATDNYYTLTDSTNYSFTENTHFFRDSVLYVDEQLLCGNICLLADSLVYIGRNTRIEDILVIAPYIYIEPGFTGNLQAFAFKQLEIGQAANLTYPSVAAVLQPNTAEKDAKLYIRQKATLEGLVLAYDGKIPKPTPRIFIEEGALVEGEIYLHGETNIRGTVYGNLIAQNFNLRTATSVYNNHLLNVELSPQKRSEHYLCPLFRKRTDKKELVKWLK